MMTDVTNIQNAYQMMIRICVRAPLMLIASLIMAFIINKEMALIFVAAVLVLGVVLFGIIFIVSPIFSRLFSRYDFLNASIQENILGIRVVKSFVHGIMKLKSSVKKVRLFLVFRVRLKRF